jgi:hypothetical protein
MAPHRYTKVIQQGRSTWLQLQPQGRTSYGSNKRFEAASVTVNCRVSHGGIFDLGESYVMPKGAVRLEVLGTQGATNATLTLSPKDAVLLAEALILAASEHGLGDMNVALELHLETT